MTSLAWSPGHLGDLSCQLKPEGSVFYWDGRLKDGSPAPSGVYRVRAQAHMNDAAVTVLSAAFVIE